MERLHIVSGMARNNKFLILIMLQLCSMTLVSGLFICLRSAAKITHKAQSVTSLAAKWHTCATIDSFDDMGTTEDTPVTNTSDRANYNFSAHFDSDMDEGDEDELDNTKMVPIYRDTISYQKRQALGELQLLLETKVVNFNQSSYIWFYRFIKPLTGQHSGATQTG